MIKTLFVPRREMSRYGRCGLFRIEDDETIIDTEQSGGATPKTEAIATAHPSLPAQFGQEVPASPQAALESPLRTEEERQRTTVKYNPEGGPRVEMMGAQIETKADLRKLDQGFGVIVTLVHGFRLRATKGNDLLVERASIRGLALTVLDLPLM